MASKAHFADPYRSSRSSGSPPDRSGFIGSGAIKRLNPLSVVIANLLNPLWLGKLGQRFALAPGERGAMINRIFFIELGVSKSSGCSSISLTHSIFCWKKQKVQPLRERHL